MNAARGPLCSYSNKQQRQWLVLEMWSSQSSVCSGFGAEHEYKHRNTILTCVMGNDAHPKKLLFFFMPLTHPISPNQSQSGQRVPYLPSWSLETLTTISITWTIYEVLGEYLGLAHKQKPAVELFTTLKIQSVSYVKWTQLKLEWGESVMSLKSECLSSEVLG